ncbi:MAG: putative DNA binding domain-containing protein [Saprospiraceae bacterium]|nr:putative DNA binding domain-containing protein [Saprospiraceae bacterium]MDW8228317.1 putative DNA binding domain-containing protein [Saprospiraceae bacterium]
MNIQKEKLLELVKRGEGLTTEFKACRNRISKEVYPTICAFLNRAGGVLLLGVEDTGIISGIAPSAVEKIRKEFVTAINNPQKISPPAYLSIDEITIDGLKVLHIYVPESSQVHRCNGRIYDRNEDCDLDITDHTEQVAWLYRRKQATYSENIVYPHITPGDLRSDLIEWCRNHVRINHKNHPWVHMNDVELLKSAQLYKTDPTTGQQGITLAGVLLLGTDELILHACPAHRTDLILRKVNMDRYDDRDLVRTNLIETYDRIMAFVRKHLPDPFYLEGDERKSLREIIFREVATNILIHREYASGMPTRFIIERGRVTTFNANRPHGFGPINPYTFSPYPKNPVIGAFFREIDRAEELGSGLRNLMKYGKIYGGADPQLIEGDVFETIIRVPEFDEVTIASGNAPGVSHEPPPEVTPEVTHEVTPEVMRVLQVVKKEMSRVEIMAALGLRDEKHFREKYLLPSLSLNLIEMTQPDKPRSSRQQYRRTSKGQNVVDKEKS